MNSETVKTKFTYRGPLPLYLSYILLLVLSSSLIFLSFRVDADSNLFYQLIITGVTVSVVALFLLLNSTKIEKIIDLKTWKKNNLTYYNDEGVFEYTHNGFTIITKEGKSLVIAWKDVIRVETHQDPLNDYIKVTTIDLYFSDRDFLSVDSSQPGFNLFEKRLKENMRKIWQEEKAVIFDSTAMENPQKVKQS